MNRRRYFAASKEGSVKIALGHMEVENEGG